MEEIQFSPPETSIFHFPVGDEEVEIKVISVISNKSTETKFLLPVVFPDFIAFLVSRGSFPDGVKKARVTLLFKKCSRF